MKFSSIKGEQEYIYNGDRMREDMLAFAYRMSGPPVQLVTQIDSFDMLKAQNELFFTYVGLRNGSLWKKFYRTAEHFQPHAYFYATSRELATPHFQIDTLPAVLVYKETNHYHFQCKRMKIFQSLSFNNQFSVSFVFSVQRFSIGRRGIFERNSIQLGE